VTYVWLYLNLAIFQTLTISVVTKETKKDMSINYVSIIRQPHFRYLVFFDNKLKWEVWTDHIP